MKQSEFKALRVAAEHHAALEVLGGEMLSRDREIKRLLVVNERMMKHRREGATARRSAQIVRLDKIISEQREAMDALRDATCDLVRWLLANGGPNISGTARSMLAEVEKLLEKPK